MAGPNSLPGDLLSGAAVAAVGGLAQLIRRRRQKREKVESAHDERLTVLELSMKEARETLEGEAPTKQHPDRPPGLVARVGMLERRRRTNG